MFESLSSKLTGALDKLRKKGVLTEADIDAELCSVPDDNIRHATIARDLATVAEVESLEELRAVDHDVAHDRICGIDRDPGRP